MKLQELLCGFLSRKFLCGSILESVLEQLALHFIAEHRERHEPPLHIINNRLQPLDRERRQ